MPFKTDRCIISESSIYLIIVNGTLHADLKQPRQQVIVYIVNLRLIPVIGNVHLITLVWGQIDNRDVILKIYFEGIVSSDSSDMARLACLFVRISRLFSLTVMLV